MPAASRTESPPEVLRERRIELLGRPVERCLVKVPGAVDDAPPNFKEERPDSALSVFGFDEFEDGMAQVGGDLDDPRFP